MDVLNYYNLYGDSAAALASNAVAYANIATNDDAFAVAAYYQNTGTNWVTGYNLAAKGIVGPFSGADDPFVSAYSHVENLFKTPADLAGYIPNGPNATAQFNNGWFYTGENSLTNFSMTPNYITTFGTNINCNFMTK